MNQKIAFILRCGFVIWMMHTGTTATINLVFPEEVKEVEVCIDFDELLNYCNEHEIQTVSGKPVWMNLMFLIFSILITMFYIPILILDYKKIRYGVKSTWDDEYRK